MNKRAVVLPVMIALIIALILGGFALYTVLKGQTASGIISKTGLVDLQKGCKDRTSALGTMAGTIVDEDNDGYADVCDYCLGVDNRIDLDGDGMPDGCEAPSDVDDNSKFDCRYGWNAYNTHCNVKS